jgi:hypothetical protein
MWPIWIRTNRAILLDENRKLDRGVAFRQACPRPKSDKIEAKSTWHHFGGKSIGSNQKIELIRRAHELNNQDAS